MWQRKQTVFLAIAIVCLVGMIFFPVWQAQSDSTLTLYPLYFKSVKGNVQTDAYFPYCVIAVLAIASATTAGMSIGKFQNRLLQLKLGALNALLMAGSMGSAAYLAIQLMQANQLSGSYGVSLYLPGIAMICNTIANRFIRKDEQLVKDSERLR